MRTEYSISEVSCGLGAREGELKPGISKLKSRISKLKPRKSQLTLRNEFKIKARDFRMAKV